MDTHSADTIFAGSVPQIYDTYLVPLIFASYATNLAAQLAELRPKRVLEIAAGTGAVTRALVAALPNDVDIVATDLSKAMLDHAAAIGTDRPIEWRRADAMALPFRDALFDVVVCQFGVMFFPDKPKAFSEARRMLAPGGTLLFNVWDRIEENEFAKSVTASLAQFYPDEPPTFLSRLPHGYHDSDTIARDLQHGGFTNPPTIQTITMRSRAVSASVAAIAYCQGTPLRSEIESHGADALAKATKACAAGMVERFGFGEVDGKIQAHIVAVET